jgi:hypothetical protein
MTLRSMFLLAAVAVSGSAALAAPPEGTVLLSSDPLVMRLNKDEFRIAFGIEAKSCMAHGCNGTVHYRVNWKASDGTARTELRQVSYAVAPNYDHTIAVDRQYLDTSEGAHTVDVVKVSVDKITLGE